NLKSIITLLVMVLFVFNASAQSSITIKGKVIDAITKEGLPGAAVTIKGTSTGTVTDVEGEFTLKLDKATEILVVSYVSYNTQEVNVKVKPNGYISDIEMESN